MTQTAPRPSSSKQRLRLGQRIWQLLPDPLKPLSTTVLVVVCLAYAGVAISAELLFPAWGRSLLSPLHLALGLAMLTALAVSLVNQLASAPGDRGRAYWLAATLCFSALVLLEAADVGSDDLLRPLLPASLMAVDFDFYGFAIGAVAVLLGLLFVMRSGVPLVLGMLAAAGFFALSAVGEEPTKWPHWVQALGPRAVGVGLQVGMLVCIQLFLVAVYRSDRGRRHAAVAVDDQSAGLGEMARDIFERGPVTHVPKHPPVRAAYYPLLQELTMFAVMAYLLVIAGVPVKRAARVPLRQQAVDMLRLWFRNGIDPPTYYAMELYLPRNTAAVPHLLTRYETKNGLLAAINRWRPNPLGANEMSDKALFARECARAGVPFPQVLASVADGAVTVHGTWTSLARDLFCKPQRGMGAKHTAAFRHAGDGLYRDEDGCTLTLDQVFHRATKEGRGKPMLVQPWLSNHPSLAGFARDSLITFRVVTCLDEQGKPEVTLAMLRLLAKLEPRWTDLPDEEYAAAINPQTGMLGLWLGDNFSTTPIHHTHHPRTGRPITGTIAPQWPALKDAALAAHRAFMHRIVIGWDIALTPEGPMVLEGNSNFDVMFLQRVHGLPIGQTRLGHLLRFHLQQLAHAHPPPLAAAA